ncbi:MAG: hypothetical protein OIN85_06985 [Candidatus Methanoperedens sp.]|nr:hypothetical protein [Candidatus Methanoperedens sp.]
MNKKIIITLIAALLFIAIFAGLMARHIPPKTPTYAQINNTLSSEWANSKNDLGKVKIAVLYETVTDGGLYGRSDEEAISVINETKADFIFRGFWRWAEVPDSCGQINSASLAKQCKISGHSYEQLANMIAKIKQENPNIIFTGAIPAQIIQRQAIWNPKTGEIINYPETWNMALDPGKWGINMSKEKFQCEFGKTQSWVPNDFDCRLYDPSSVPAYFPDITNPEYRKLLISWGERQIDAGADGVWIDMLTSNSGFLARLTKDINHPGVKATYEATNGIVDELHEYGKSKNRTVFIGTWSPSSLYPYAPANYDFVTISPRIEEVRAMKLNESRWDSEITSIRQRFGSIPVFVFIDWASTTNTQLGAFSQALTKEQQSEFLTSADNFFTSRGFIFIYPLHGGWMGEDATVLSFGKLRYYDSLAPEFDTYQTIKELANNKARISD